MYLNCVPLHFSLSLSLSPIKLRKKAGAPPYHELLDQTNFLIKYRSLTVCMERRWFRAAFHTARGPAIRREWWRRFLENDGECTQPAIHAIRRMFRHIITKL